MATTTEDKLPIVNVFIADYSHMACQLMAAALRRSRYRLSVSGVATDLQGVRAAFSKAKQTIDVAIISAELREGPLSGFAVTREIHAIHSKLGIISLLKSSERLLVVEAFRAGAKGILSREQPFEVVCKCIHAVHLGQVWATSREIHFALDALSQNEPLPATVPKVRSRAQLTKREESVVHLVAEGLTNKDISRQLKLSENTVRNYLFRIFNKVGTSNRLELALFAISQKQLEPQSQYE